VIAGLKTVREGDFPIGAAIEQSWKKIGSVGLITGDPKIGFGELDWWTGARRKGSIVFEPLWISVPMAEPAFPFQENFGGGRRRSEFRRFED